MTSNIKLIAHRGNALGPNEARENSPSYIDEAIAKGFDVEIDLWANHKGDFFLGHNIGNHHVDYEWLHNRKEKLWIHTKNFAALRFLKDSDFNYFFHEDDDFTLTSKCDIWAHPRVSAQEVKGVVYVIQGRRDDEFAKTIISGRPLGICSDYVARIRRLLEEQKYEQF